MSAKLPTPLFVYIWPPAHVLTATIVLKCISDEFWKKNLKLLTPLPAVFSLIQFKVLDKLSKLYPDRITEAGSRCSQSPFNLTHMLWSCPKLFSYWQSCFKSMPDILGLNMNASLHVAIVGPPRDELRAATTQNNVLAFAFLVARKKILLLWKPSRPPSFKARLQNSLVSVKVRKS